MRSAFDQCLGNTRARARIIVATLTGRIDQLALFAHKIPIATEKIIKVDVILDDAAIVEFVCLALRRRFVDASLLRRVKVLPAGTCAVLEGLLVGTVVVAKAGLGITDPRANSIRARQATFVGVGQRLDTFLAVLVEERGRATAVRVGSAKIYAFYVSRARFGIGYNGFILEQGANIFDAYCARTAAQAQKQHAQQA